MTQFNTSKITKTKLRSFSKQAIKVLNVNPTDNYEIIDSNLPHSCYYWDGKLGISQPQLQNIQTAITKYNNNEKLSDFDVYHIVELLHEELHGCCPVFYTAINKWTDKGYRLRTDFTLIEETSVELMARLATLHLGIKSEQSELPTYKNGKWKHSKHEYLDYACEMADFLSSITNCDKNESLNNIINASCSIRKNKRVLYYMFQYVKLFGIHLGLNKNQISKFMKYYYDR